MQCTEDRQEPAVDTPFLRDGLRQRRAALGKKSAARRPPKTPGQPRNIHRQNFLHDTRGYRTGAHTDETSTPLEGPWTPLQQPYSISHRAGPQNASPRPVALSASLIRRIFISVIFFRIPFATPTCAAAASCCVWCTKNDLALVLEPAPYDGGSVSGAARARPAFARSARRRMKCKE